jgi:phosphoglycolate phosphatase-like HAD superfamily hydrolase
MLLLFDIDGTLLITKRSGILAMELAGRELFDPNFTVQGVDFAGRLDPLISHDLLVKNRVERSEGNLRAFRDGYRRHLMSLLSDGTDRTQACPGVHGVIEILAKQSDAVLGVLTGNWPETGTFKLRSAGIDPEVFEIAVWGDESPHERPAREHLPPVAMSRFAQRRGREVLPEQVTIIGDTPHDVHCAKAHGCRVLGVGTGLYSPEQLIAAGADHAVTSLADEQGTVDWLLQV